MPNDRAERRAWSRSPGGWGLVGDAAAHERYLVALPNRRKKCRSREHTGRVAATHQGRANGLALTYGCEWHMYQWQKTGRSA